MRTVLLRSDQIAGKNLRVGLVSRDQLRSPAHVHLGGQGATVLRLICAPTTSCTGVGAQCHVILVQKHSHGSWISVARCPPGCTWTSTEVPQSSA